MPEAETTVRHAARVLLIDDRDRVVLLRFGPDHHGRYFWICPGGGLEAGESPACVPKASTTPAGGPSRTSGPPRST